MKRRTATRRKMTKVRVRHRSGPVRLRTSRGVVLARVLRAGASVPLDRVVEVDFLVALEARGRAMVVEAEPLFAAGVTTGISASVDVVAAVASRVDRWDIERRIVPRVSSSRNRSRPLCHHLHHSSRSRVLVATARRVEVVLTTIRVMLSLMLRGSISTPRIPIPWVAILSIRAAICRILQLQ